MLWDRVELRVVGWVQWRHQDLKSGGARRGQ